MNALATRVRRLARQHRRQDGPCRCAPPIVFELVDADQPNEAPACDPPRCPRCGGHAFRQVVVEVVVEAPECPLPNS
jgi:hypothetical protein